MRLINCIKCKEETEFFAKEVCKKCYYRIRSRAIYNQNKELGKEKVRSWQDKNKDKVLLYKKNYREKNKEKLRSNNRTEEKRLQDNANSRKSKRKNRAFCYYLNSKRRGTIKKSTPLWVDRNEMTNIFKDVPDEHSVDHIIPLINENVCGLNVPWNLQYLTTYCNSSKGNKFDFTYDNVSWLLDIVKNKKAA